MDKKLILLIEDDKAICCSLAQIIQKWGFNTILTYDGKDGLTKVKEQKPDLVILDLTLPKLPGKEVCRQIRNDDATHAIPIIMQTGKTSDADRIIGRVIGADCYLTKPYDLNELLRQINKLTGGN